MIIIDLFFFIIALFFLLPVVLGGLVWFKVRSHPANPFQADNARRAKDTDVIEGQYEVVDDNRKDSA